MSSLPVEGFSLIEIMEGHETQLSSLLNTRAEDRRGSVAIFWSAVCSHCRRYDEFLRRFENQFPSLSLLVIGCREGESLEDLRAAAGQRDLAFPLYLDTDGALSRAWGVQQTPTAILLSARPETLYRGAIDNFTYPHSPDHVPYLDHAIEDWLSDRPLRLKTTAAFGCPIASVYYRMAPHYGLATLSGRQESPDGRRDSAETDSAETEAAETEAAETELADTAEAGAERHEGSEPTRQEVRS